MACMSGGMHACTLEDRHVGADMASMLHANRGHACAEHAESYEEAVTKQGLHCMTKQGLHARAGLPMSAALRTGVRFRDETD